MIMMNYWYVMDDYGYNDVELLFGLYWWDIIIVTLLCLLYCSYIPGTYQDLPGIHHNSNVLWNVIDQTHFCPRDISFKF